MDVEDIPFSSDLILKCDVVLLVIRPKWTATRASPNARIRSVSRSNPHLQRRDDDNPNSNVSSVGKIAGVRPSAAECAWE